jgi:carbonic anhydrase
MSNIELQNNKKSLMVNYPEERGGTFKPYRDSVIYNLASLHFHWGEDDNTGSEHTREGEHFPLELHMVHWSVLNDNLMQAVRDKVNGGLAVVGVLFTIGEENAALKVLTDQLIQVKAADSTVNLASPWSVADLLPAGWETEYQQYAGALTIPGCHETVTWTVLQKPISVSREQLVSVQL